MAKRKATLKEDWYWFNGGWQVEGEDDEGRLIFRKVRWRNLPQRVAQFVWEQWISVWVCKKYGHKWEPVEDAWSNLRFSCCTRCGVDTEPPTCYC